ncbi:Myb-like dna-binding protein [Globisporangium polare]
MVNSGVWSEEEHDRFLIAIKQFPQGPWASIADAIATRSVRQVQTHTQKYYEKIMRRMRGVRKERKTWARLEHRIEDDILEFCKIMHSARARNGSNSASAASSPGSSKPTSPAGSTTTTVKKETAENPDETMIKLEEIDEGALDSGDDSLDLPSLEESLDFFIASLEHDADFP